MKLETLNRLQESITDLSDKLASEMIGEENLTVRGNLDFANGYLCSALRMLKDTEKYCQKEEAVHES